MQQDQETLMFGHSGFEETLVSQQDTQPQHLDGTSVVNEVGGVQKWWQDNKVSIISLLIILAGVGYAFGQYHQSQKMEMRDAAQAARNQSEKK